MTRVTGVTRVTRVTRVTWVTWVTGVKWLMYILNFVLELEPNCLFVRCVSYVHCISCPEVP